jgi:hypothetical protein
MAVLKEPATQRRLLTVDRFFDEAGEMRKVFDERLGNQRSSSRERFVWDYWHVPDQYTYIRTFADEFFPPDLYQRFLDRLLGWGREQLGCTAIVPPWLSYYIDGCGQELHADVPHGDWAWVFSLTNWDERTWSGGETFLLNEQTLDFWGTLEERRGAELESFAELVESPFNRLTVFDPRIPHGVRRVYGTRDPLDSRIAVHGWFRAPGVVLSEASEPARAAIEATVAMLLLSLRELEGVEGLVATRLELSADGSVADSRVVSSSLVSTGGGAVEEAEQAIVGFLAESRLPALSADAWAVVPVALPVAQPSAG